jgi:hypothetical protein
MTGSSAIDAPLLRDLPPRMRSRRPESPRVEVLPSNGEEEGNVEPRLADSRTPLVTTLHQEPPLRRADWPSIAPISPRTGDRIRDAIDVAEGSEITFVRATPRRALLLVSMIEVPSVHRDRFVVRSLPLRNSTGLRACPILADLRARRADASIHRTPPPRVVGRCTGLSMNAEALQGDGGSVFVRRSPAVVFPYFGVSGKEPVASRKNERERQR